MIASCVICKEPGPPTVAEVKTQVRDRVLTGYRPICGMCLAPWVPFNSNSPRGILPIGGEGAGVIKEEAKQDNEGPGQGNVPLSRLFNPLQDDEDLWGNKAGRSGGVVPSDFTLPFVDVLPFDKRSAP